MNFCVLGAEETQVVQLFSWTFENFLALSWDTWGSLEVIWCLFLEKMEVPEYILFSYCCWQYILLFIQQFINVVILKLFQKLVFVED